MRIVEILVGLSAIGSIATFLGLKWTVQRTIRKLGRRPEDIETTAVERRTDEEDDPFDR